MEKYFLPMLTLCMSSGYLHASTPKNRMNIVLIMADDFGYECIGANGGNYQTPHIDKLAEEGIRFEHCHSNPLSTPSRVQLMTGKYNVHNYVAFGKLDRGEDTFWQHFKKYRIRNVHCRQMATGQRERLTQTFRFRHFLSVATDCKRSG